jgi:hypothetical protein
MTATAPASRYKVALINRRQAFEDLGYEPHVAQWPIHESEARHRVAACGRRFGKSIVGGHELALEAYRGFTLQEELRRRRKRREFWIVGPEYSDSEKEFRALWNALSSLEFPFDRPGSYYNPEHGPMVISLWGGTTIFHAKSAKYPSTLVGEGLAGVVMAEAAKLKSTVWTKYIRPTLADVRGWSLWLSTPEGKNHFYDTYMRGLDPADHEWAGWRLPSWMNPIVFPLGEDDPEVLDMKKDMSDEKFEQEIGASFTEFVGLVFKRFEEELHVGDLRPIPGRPLWGAVDYGWTNPFVWLEIQVDYDGNVNVLREYYRTERDTNEHAEALARMGVSNERYAGFFPDPAEPDDTHTLKEALHIPARGNTGGPLRVRLDLIREALKQRAQGMTASGLYIPRPKLMVDRSCVNLIREMTSYRYPDTKEEAQRNPKDEPQDKDNHGPEALGRFMRGYFGTSRPRSRSRQAVMAR